MASPYEVAVHAQDFTLSWLIDAQRVSSADPLDLEATLVYVGDADGIRAWAGFYLVNFWLRQVDGPLHLEPVIESIGICHVVVPGVGVRVPYRKSGVHAEPGDPNYPVMNQFLTDPELHFPPGRWRITAIADFGVGCSSGPGAKRVHIEAPGEIVVTE